MFRWVLPRALLIAVLALDSLGAAADDIAVSASLNSVVDGKIRPPVERLLLQLVREGRSMRVDGMPVFNGSDKFLPGKIALAFADVIATLGDDDPRLPQYVADFRSLAALTADDPNDTWGIYYYLSALRSLEQRGQLRAALDPLTLAKLRVRLDWRSFADADTYTLIEHPTNYYCVAFAIARLRHDLGWEDAVGPARLYAAIAAHYQKFSGSSGFSDETEGEGRFDRYSILLAGEIAERFMETGDQPPAQVLGWLRKSVEVLLPRINLRGEGFEYGRSLGPYGETAIVEVLTAAAVLGVLNQSEKDLAYAYATRVARRYADFWLDAATGSVNLWDGGRRTDAYRGKFRILGENFSLAHQYLYTSALWNRIGYRESAPVRDFEVLLERLPARNVTWFARGAYDRVLLTLRDQGRVVSLPLINGGASQHMNSPYFPIPFSPGMLAGIPDSDEPLLLPRFELEDGSALMPLAYFRDVRISERGASTQISYRQSELDRMGGEAPVGDDRISVTTTYAFAPGSITRTDTYTPRQSVAVKRVAMAFGTFSLEPSQSALTTRFATGAITSFEVSGFDECKAGATAESPDYRTPTGPFKSKVLCTRGAFTLSQPITLRWRIQYQQPRNP